MLFAFNLCLIRLVVRFGMVILNRKIILPTHDKIQEIEWFRVLETINKRKSLNILSLIEVAEIIKTKDNTATRKWLEKKGIKIYKDTKAHYVYEIDVAVEIDKPWVVNLINKYPEKWKDIYKKTVKDNAVYEMVLLSLGEDLSHLPTTKIKSLNGNDKKLFEKLTA